RNVGGEAQRRAAANRLAQAVFDENGDPDTQFGARPSIDLTVVAGNLHAFQTISVPDTHAYKPDLQPNLQNAAHGDIVSGTYNPANSADPAPSEDANYARNDFNPAIGGDTTPANNTAFLVRLRRSNELPD